jgi:PAS domain S-box-containing protein
MNERRKPRSQLQEELKLTQRRTAVLEAERAKWKQVERALREALWFSDSLVRSMPEGLSVLDHGGVHVDVNDAFCRMTGFSREELMGVSPPYPYWPPESYEQIEHAFEEMLAARACQFELTFMRKSGERFPAIVSPVYVRDKQGEVVNYLAVVKDITERRRAEDSHRESERRLFTLLSNLPGIAYRCRNDADWTMEFISEGCLRLTGYPVSDLLDNRVISFGDIIHPDDRDMVRNEVERGVSEGRHFEITYRIRTASGEQRWVWEQGVAIGAGNEVLEGFITDITDRQRAEDELRAANARLEQAVARAEELAVRAEAANRAKSQFLANMSHEIRTPMTAILGFAELLASSDLSSEEQCEFLAAIRENGQALLDLIGDILDLSQIEADRMMLEKADCPLRQVIDSVLGMLRLRAEQKGLGLDVDYAFPLPETIYTDPVRLRQVLANLIGNAIKFTEQGTVRIAVDWVMGPTGSGRLRVAVSDTGIGIAADRIDELFEPFTQLDGSFTRRYGGTGLGLAISQRLARELGGDVEVTSRMGEGSTFTLTIDVGSLAGVRMARSPEDPATTKGQRCPTEQEAPLRGRVLLAEDVAALSSMLRQLLTKMKLEVETVADGRGACEAAEKSLAEQKPFDLILMDMQMPHMDGYQATAWLRQGGWTGPVVALTAHALAGDREKCMAAGCDDYLAKPISVKALRDVLIRHLGEHAVSQQGP